MPTVLTPASRRAPRPATLLTTAPPQPPGRARSTGVLRNGVSVVLALVMLLSVADALAAFRPKEYDFTLTTQFKNCEMQYLDQGMCQGGNWALAFAQGLHYAKCLASTTKQPRLSSEELLRCTQASFETCATPPQDLSVVDTIKTYLVNAGLATDACLTYQQTFNFQLNPASCPTQCDDGSTKTAHTVASDVVVVSGTTTIQDRIISKGPVILAIKDVPSLNAYTSGLYTPTANEPTFGIRFLLVLGWSTTISGEVQWKCQATLGSTYGTLGRINVSALNPNILAYYGFTL